MTRRVAALISVLALTIAAAPGVAQGAEATGKPKKKPKTTTLVDNLYDRLEADDWSLGEGLVATLEFLNGTGSRRDVTSRRLTNDDFTVVAEAARAYVGTPKKRPREKRIVELLGDLFPTPAELRSLAGDGSPPTSGFRGPPPGDEIDCAELWRGDAAALPGRCLEVFELALDGGVRALVYTPLEGVRPEQAAFYEELVREALPAAWSVYDDFGAMPNVDVVFDPRDVTSFAGAAMAIGEPTCVLMIRPATLEESNVDARFIVAHEAFHCFQQHVLESFRVSGPGTLWWKEASANYFANVVYPDANTEWDYLPEVRGLEPGTSLLDFSYAASYFFQHLANAQGNAQAIELLGHLAGDGKPADWPGMAELFHAYAEAFLTDGILDTSGPAIPIGARDENQGRYRPTGPGPVYRVEPRPFVIERALVEWQEDREFDIETRQVGDVRVSAQPHPDGAWGALPDPISTCDGSLVHRILATAIERPGGQYELDVVNVEVRDPGSACCPGGSKPCIIVNGLRGRPSVYVGGICYLDDGFLNVAAGYGAYDDTTLVEQDSPYPRGYVFILGIATPGFEPEGFPNVSVTDGTQIIPEISVNATLTKAPDLLTGTFTATGISGSYYCPAFTPLP